MFDFTFHMGDLIAVIGFLGTLVLFMLRIEGRLNIIAAQRTMEAEQHNTKFDAIEKQLSKVADCMLQLARQDEQIATLREKIESVIDIVRPKKARQSRSKT